MSMSALWVRQPGWTTHSTTIERTMQFRTAPAVFEVPSNGTSTGEDAHSVLANVYDNLLANWLYRVRASFFCEITTRPGEIICPSIRSSLHSSLF